MQGNLHEWINDGGTVTTIGILLALYRKVNIMSYQHRLIWTWFKREHGITNGEVKDRD